MLGAVGRVGRPTRAGIFGPARAWANACTTKPSGDRLALNSRAMRKLHSSGLWAKLDMYMPLAAGEDASDSQPSRVDWRNPSRVATAVNAPTYTANFGFTFNGTNYLNTNFNVSTAANFSQDSACFGAWSLEQNGNNSSGVGAWDGSDGLTLAPRQASSDRTTARVNQSDFNRSVNGTVTDGRGFYCITRTAAAQSLSRNGVVQDSTYYASTAPNNMNIYVGGISTGILTSGKYGLVFAGGYLTTTEVQTLYAITYDLFSEVGAI